MHSLILTKKNNEEELNHLCDVVFDYYNEDLTNGDWEDREIAQGVKINDIKTVGDVKKYVEPLTHFVSKLIMGGSIVEQHYDYDHDWKPLIPQESLVAIWNNLLRNYTDNEEVQFYDIHE